MPQKEMTNALGDALVRGIEALVCWPENKIFLDDCSLFERDGTTSLEVEVQSLVAGWTP